MRPPRPERDPDPLLGEALGADHLRDLARFDTRLLQKLIRPSPHPAADAEGRP